MEIVFKVTACALIGVILSLVLSTRNKEISLLLTAAVSCLIAITMLTYLQPSFDFLQKLGVMGNIAPNTLNVLLKSTGIAILTEITGLICTDAGHSSISKVLQLFAEVIILWLSLPLLNQMMDLLSGVIGSV